VLVGELSEAGGYSDFFATKGVPEAPLVVVKAVEAALADALERADRGPSVRPAEENSVRAMPTHHRGTPSLMFSSRGAASLSVCLLAPPRCAACSARCSRTRASSSKATSTTRTRRSSRACSASPRATQTARASFAPASGHMSLTCLLSRAGGAGREAVLSDSSRGSSLSIGSPRKSIV
jgi:hypothetical protein